MSMDLNIKALRTNEYRESKIRGEFMVSIRVPGAIFPVNLLPTVQKIAERYGDGTIHMGTRQKIAIPRIKAKDIDSVNKMLQPIIEEIECNICGVDIEDTTKGYPTIGARNITNCIGNVHCVKANVNTVSIARRFEKTIFPNHYHIKISVAGCPNDCVKATFSDFGIIGVSKIDFDYYRCIGCGACVKACKNHATNALAGKNGKAVKEESKCIGCGECVLVCPTSAWTRNPKKFFRVKIGGRTGKKTPRAGKTFLNWVTEEHLHQIVKNIFKFSDYMLEGKPVYLHFGHLIDKAGYNKFKDFVLDGIELNQEALVADRIYWYEDETTADIHLKSNK
ncbi:anaerobic sulfite reductase subunit C [Gottschalkia purinilytica]|uniref:Anaerobic sulfite reductase subunit C n=1 Tax=Gottschalkia purinilytica TaxID=1503 RepID=A0A0L0W887_GOTPU|nr:sulfite reductase subunit C [Gottschalkia purinilytica]KNF07661.1 anaerobic sulfite reductase subunit C [Gottschalkia purinilytica]